MTNTAKTFDADLSSFLADPLNALTADQHPAAAAVLSDALTDAGFDVALARFVAEWQGQMDMENRRMCEATFKRNPGTYADPAAREEHLSCMRRTLTIERGRRYVRVWRHHTSDVRSGSRGSAMAFVDMTGGMLHGIPSKIGDILKPDGWKKPAKHARGNIFTMKNIGDAAGPFGVRYL